MKPIRLYISVLLLLSLSLPETLHAGPGDTTRIQTFTFDSISTRRAWFQFPDSGQSWNKILMYYTIKCDPQTPYDGYECGEWDYTTFTHVHDHTGIIDSTATSHPGFLANGESPDSLLYVNTPLYHTFAYPQTAYHITDTNSLNQYEAGTGSTQLGLSSGENARTLMLYTAAELNALGLTPGTINALTFKLTHAGVSFRRLKIRMQHSSETSFSPAFSDTLNLTTAFNAPVSSDAGGNVHCLLYPAFTWDGSSSLLIELSYEDPSQAVIAEADDPGDQMTALFNDADACLSFEGPDYLEVPADAFTETDQSITLSMWVHGNPDYQPQDDMLFEAKDSAGNRILNVHLPWSNGNVYWDAGYSNGSYDRIDKAADQSVYAGSWNHWAFVKDASTGTMEIYLNGDLWHSGTGNTKSMEGITRFVLGGDKNTSPNRSYDGKIDEFRVWNTALDQQTIQDYMFVECSSSHPDWDNLAVYYPMNNLTDGVCEDASPHNNNGYAIGMPQPETYHGWGLRKAMTILNFRPYTVFEQAGFVQSDTCIYHTDSVPAEQICLISRNIVDNELINMDTSYVWEAGWSYSFDPQTGEKADSSYSGFDDIIHQYELVTYSNPFEIVNTIQMQNFVTPYGINLDLNGGFTWVYDVTDYAMFLHDSVDLQAHNTQELLDLEFAFIEGQPPRDIVDFSQIWRGNYGHHAIATDEALPAKKHQVHANADQVIVRTRTTGHGMAGDYACAEFCPTTHHLDINGTEVSSWQNWTECADNPIYPQGGTWIFDRAGWCPGKFADTYNWDVTDYLTPGDSASIDYGMTQYPGSDGGGNYQVAVQCIEYGAPNYTHEAAITNIIKPSDADPHSRFNPACAQPEIVIRNEGSQTISNLEIQYGLDGNTNHAFTWTGQLEFMEKEHVTLPAIGWEEMLDSNGQFTARVSAPNGNPDEYSGNNQMNTSFEMVTVYDVPIMLTYKTNNYGLETSYEIRNASGELVKEVSGLDNSTTYYDTLNLNAGCYELIFMDEGQDGLNFWYTNSETGTGFAGIRQVG
ncbi:MAG TPA: LamG-like jellyroll fold domain-containing protein, partial [Bacteroidales bacterium]|nr:LamG-like jellyroll fold domain-containing protein [Bacteroidales bacterium]